MKTPTYSEHKKQLKGVYNRARHTAKRVNGGFP